MVNNYKVIIDNALRKYLPQTHRYPKVICEAIKYSLFPGGKRLRAILCLATAKIFNKNINNAIPTACAIECIHNYSLVYDDLPCMDNDDYRRGRLTTHRKFNEAIAVLTGSALIALAFEIVIDYTKSSSDIILKIIRELAEVTGIKGLVTGQVVDIKINEIKEKNLLSEFNNLWKIKCSSTEEVFSNVYLYKTAYLFRAAVRCAAILNNATDDELTHLTSFGEKFGLAYQILDDLKDIKKDELTYLKVYGEDKSKKMILKLKNEAKEQLEYFGKRSNELIEITNDVIS